MAVISTTVTFFKADGEKLDSFTYKHPISKEDKKILRTLFEIFFMLFPNGYFTSGSLRDGVQLKLKPFKHKSLF